MKHLILGFIFVIFVVVVMIILIDYSDDTNHSVSYTFNSAKNCEDTSVKNLVIEIFKEHNEYYKDIDKNSISEISLRYPASSSYDRDIDKYFCTGTIVMKSAASGFLPTSYDYYANKYLNKSYANFYELYKYDTFELNLDYDSQISEGQTLVHAAVSGGEFSCSYGSCDMIPNVEREKERIRQKLEEEAQEQRDRHVFLPD